MLLLGLIPIPVESIQYMNNLKLRLFRFFCVVFVGVLADLGTKAWIFNRLGAPGAMDTWWLIPNVFGFQTSLNQGALFGIGQGKIVLFVIFSVVAITGIMAWIVFDKRKSLYITLTLGMITAGILGNLWDRLGLHQLKWTPFDAWTGQCTAEMVGTRVHAVRDWILVMIGSYHWPNFNIADSLLVCGAILIFIYAWIWGDPFTVEKLKTESSEQTGQTEQN
ncbi:MAG: signal peptidase II [Planctomycetia bacterium]|nr:signal peptidase II [Planctomycetia bacterium]